MKLVELDSDDLVISDDLRRSGSAKQFEDRLRSSIEQIGLVEPLKVAPLSTGKYLVVDGNMRLKAIEALRKKDPAAFKKIPVYVVDYDRRYELRYQTDIYQDLLPSQLAELVEHLHQTEHILKADIARYIGVSPATLRNYTGLWRLLQRGGLFAKIVELMDWEVIPSSNPYAWLRLTEVGLRYVLEHEFGDNEDAEEWIARRVLDARRGKAIRFPIKLVEGATNALPPEFYREGEGVRTLKRDLGLRRAGSGDTIHVQNVQPELDLPDITRRADSMRPSASSEISSSEVVRYPARAQQVVAPPESRRPEFTGPKSEDINEAVRYLSLVSNRSLDPVLRSAARSLEVYLR